MEGEDETDDGWNEEEDADGVETVELREEGEILFLLWCIDVEEEDHGEESDAAGDWLM